MTDPQAHSEGQDFRDEQDVVETLDDPAPPAPHGESFGSDTQHEPFWPVDVPESVPAGPELVACTVAGSTQLPATEVLRRSFQRQHPSARFVVLVTDPMLAADAPPGLSVLTPGEIGVDTVELARLAMACTSTQLAAVLRPRLLRHLLGQGTVVVHLGTSVEVFGPLDAVVSAATSERPLALVPRVLRPLPSDGLRPAPGDLAAEGTFEPDLFAVGPGAEGFLDVWAEQVCLAPGVAATFLDGAPALVDHQVVRDPGMSLSVWNAAHRELHTVASGAQDAVSMDQYLVDGQPLRTVHFTGFQPQRPWLLSADFADRPRLLLSENPHLARLCATYRNALIEAGDTGRIADRYESLPDGPTIPAPLRAAYAKAWADTERSGEPCPPSPFEPGSDARATFLRWASEAPDARHRQAGLSRWTAAVWESDPVLRRDFPDPLGGDAASFRDWCADVGVGSGRVPPESVGTATDTTTALVDQLGVAVLGAGRIAELVRSAVGTSGLPTADAPHYPVVVRCDPTVPVPAGRYLIDVRTDAMPSPEAAETWVLSQASRTAARAHGDSTVRVVPLPVADHGPVGLASRKGIRAGLEMDDQFVVATFVDHTDERRGNVLAAVNAFLAAFPEREDVRLVVAVSGAARASEAAERLRLATVTDPRIHLVDDRADTTNPSRSALLAADCVLSLHRADDGGDGDALTLATVASRGIPVIAAEHGAAAELLGPQGATLIACRSGSEPDVGTAAVTLTALAGDVAALAEAGRAARDHLLTEHTAARAGQRLRERVESAYRTWRNKWAKDRAGHADDPLHPLLVARHALHRPPDVGAGGRNAMAPAMRKAVFRVLGHYDQHLREILRSLLDGVEQTSTELLRRQSALDGGDLDVDGLRRDLARVEQRLDQLDARHADADDGLVRTRADVAEQDRRLRELESSGAGADPRVDALTERIDRLTSAVERTLDRVDAVERRQSDDERAREHQSEAGVRAASQDANHALQRTDVLQRILLREHERTTGGSDGTSTPVLCDAGLLRLPSQDSMMLPWLSSHSTWDAEVSTLIDSLLEPDGVFLDVGSYVGYQSVRVLSRLGTSGAVVAVEPCPESRALLNHNVEMNVPAAVAERLVVLDAAAWDGPGELLAESSLAGGVDARSPDDDHSGEAVPVRAVRLDKEWDRLDAVTGLSLSVVHVDVGGRVHRVLGGLVRLLRKEKPSIVCTFTPSAVYALGDDPAAALREFGTWGYDLVPVGRSNPVGADELLAAMDSAGSTSVKLWLRPKGRPEDQ
ncbi:FkbM family methyltransferase [Allosaccharopolyspora coralli]|uniref:FkbM family methyltransferase n=1 Tax=Allosaccharopolyspora coralli TaxID=2665642 RepID=UPI001E54C2E1|nr:FkbM family methyltransferase [Allosaccharopolyspora coralli]